MKRLIPLLLTIVLLCGCAAITTPTETTAPDYGDIPLPEFSQLQPNSLSYCDVTPEALQAYIDLLCAQGFQYVGDEYSKFLYRDDAIINISDNSKSYGECGLQIDLAKKADGGTNVEAVKARLSNEGESDILFVMEQTPDELYKACGAQLFLALFPMDDDLILSPKYYIAKYLATDRGFLPFPSYAEFLCDDLDADGRTELLVKSPGPTSGVYTVSLTAYEIIDGVPVVDGASLLWPKEWADYSLTERDGQPQLRVAPDEDSKEPGYPVTLYDNTLQADGIDCRQAIPYLSLPTDKGLEVYVWQVGGDYACGLMMGTNRNKIPSEINELLPVSLETMHQILSEYEISRSCISVYFTDRPATDTEFIKTVSQTEREEVLSRLFS